MPGFVTLAFRMYSVEALVPISRARKLADSNARGLAHTSTFNVHKVTTPSYTHEGMGEEEICNMSLLGLVRLSGLIGPT